MSTFPGTEKLLKSLPLAGGFSGVHVTKPRTRKGSSSGGGSMAQSDILREIFSEQHLKAVLSRGMSMSVLPGAMQAK